FCRSAAPAADVSSTVAVASCGPSTGLASVGSVPESPLETWNVPGWASEGGGSTATIIVTLASPGATATTLTEVAACAGLASTTSTPASTASATAASRLRRRGEDDDIVEVVVGLVVELPAAGDQPQRRLQVGGVDVGGREVALRDLPDRGD